VSLCAWADESFEERQGGGFYIIAAAVLAPHAHAPAREAMLALRGRRRTAKSHWTEMDAKQRLEAAERVAGMEGLHLVATGAPVPAKRQERARARCLTTLVPELHGFGVEHLFIEARQPALNARDITTVMGARHSLPKGSRFRVDHIPGAEEPLLWLSDVVAGACRAEQLGDSAYREMLGQVVLDFSVATDC
jgi:hypothetical protein